MTITMSSPYPPGVKLFEYHRITEQVLAGRNPLMACDVELLCGAGVTHILDLREAAEWQPPNIGQEAVDFQHARGVRRKHLPIPDFQTPQAEDFAAAVAFLEETLQDPAAQVYIHCRAGMERTPTILIAYFALQWETDCAETLRRLKAKRSIFQPLEWQYAAVERWLKGQRKVEGGETNPQPGSF
jgi:predicted protein tyrosine phosphatase